MLTASSACATNRPWLGRQVVENRYLPAQIQVFPPLLERPLDS